MYVRPKANKRSIYLSPGCFKQSWALEIFFFYRKDLKKTDFRKGRRKKAFLTCPISASKA